jgi:hypothetical protein
VPAAFGKHLMQRAAREPALQRCIGLAMAERDPPRHRSAMRLDALDARTQRRKRASHAAPPLIPMLAVLIEKPEAGSFVHDMF